MNKTVSINLAGIFFHIDEDAYQNLKNYFKAIKKSLQNSEGESEIIADIEGRVAELFSERIKSSQHVILNKEVDEIVSIMGQPEDYKIDEDLFEEAQEKEKSDSQKRRLFRDPDAAYVGGVSAGLGHYFVLGNVDLVLLASLLIGSLPAIHFGTKLAKRMPSDLLQTGIALILLGLGINFIVS